MADRVIPWTNLPDGGRVATATGLTPFPPFTPDVPPSKTITLAVPANLAGQGTQAPPQAPPQSPTPPAPPSPNTASSSSVPTPPSGVSKDIPVSEISHQIPHFLQSVLSTPAGALPKGPLWAVVFEDSYAVNSTTINGCGIPKVITKVSQYEPRSPLPWKIEAAVKEICSAQYMTTKACILAQNVTLPGEGIDSTGVEGLQYNGFIRGKVGNGRDDYEPIKISFLNTNVSFVDNVIRPWVIMTGHLGLIARDGDLTYRTNMKIIRFGSSDRKKPPFILQTFTFYGVCPVSVDAEEYTQDGSVNITKSASFIYQWYTVDSSKNAFNDPSLNKPDIYTVPPANNGGVTINPPASYSYFTQTNLELPVNLEKQTF